MEIKSGVIRDVSYLDTIKYLDKPLVYSFDDLRENTLAFQEYYEVWSPLYDALHNAFGGYGWFF